MVRLLDRRRRLDRLTRLVALAGFLAMLTVAVVTVLDVLLRWIFRAPIEGLDDLSQLIFAIVIAACFPAGLLQGHNITIRFLGRAIGHRLERWLEAFGALLTLAVFAILAWQFVLLTLEFEATGRTSMTVGIPIAPFWWVVTGVIALTLPVQIIVVAARLAEALSQRPVEVARDAPPDFLAGAEAEEGAEEAW